MREHSTGLNPSLRVDSSLGALKSLAQIIVGLSAGEFKASILRQQTQVRSHSIVLCLIQYESKTVVWSVSHVSTFSRILLDD